MNALIVKAKNAFANKNAEMYVSKVVWTLAVIVVGMLLMGIIYNIFNSTVATGLNKNIKSIFTKADTAVSGNGNGGAYNPTVGG